MSTLVSGGPPPADDAVPVVAQELCRAVDDVHRGMAASLTRSTLDPVRNTAAAAASAHAGILEHSGLVDADPPGALSARTVARYRADVVARVLNPLLDVLDDVEPGAAVGAAWEDARARFHELIERAPEELVVPEPAGLFRSRPEDPALLRWRKSAIRLSRAAAEVAAELGDGMRRTLGRAPDEPAAPEARLQRVPLRDLVASHIELRLPPLQVDLVDALAAHFAAPVACLHRAVDHWGRAVLDVEIATDPAGQADRAEEEYDAPAAAAAHFAAVHQAAQTLQTALEEIAATRPAEQATAAQLEALVVAEDRLVADIETAGSPLEGRPLDADGRDRYLRALDRHLDLRADWQRRTRASMRAILSVLAGRAATHALLHGAATDVADAARALSARLDTAAPTLRERRAELARASERTAGTGSGRLHDTLEDAARHLPSILDQALAPPGDDGPAGGLLASIDERIARLRARIAELPVEPIGATAGARRHPRALLADAFDPARLERIRAAAEASLGAFRDALDEAARMRAVVDDALHAALAAVERTDDPEPASTLDESTALAIDGLDSAAHSLERMAAGIAAEPGRFERAASAILHAGWTEVAARLRADDGDAPQPAPGAGPATFDAVPPDATASTREVRAGADAVGAAYPGGYAQLFELGAPGDDAAEGRSRELDVVRRHVLDRRDGLTDALVISDWSGDAAAAFAAAALDALHAGTDVRTVRFAERTLDEASVAARIAAVLDPDGDTPATLDALADRILQADRAWPAVALANAEMLLLRTSAGNGMIGPLLPFLSATDARICWIVSVARAAWSYIERVEPEAACLARHLPLGPCSRSDLEALILARHARSGLALEFEEPRSPSPRLRLRLARVRDTAARQDILRTAFFDRLAESAGPDLALARLHWLRATRLAESGAHVRVGPLEPLRSSFLDALDADQGFALKALLQHGTLTIAEHDAVVAVPRELSRAVFASLADRMLIEPAVPTGEPPSLAARDAVPWRLRPLVLQPVLSLLRARNLGA